MNAQHRRSQEQQTMNEQSPVSAPVSAPISGSILEPIAFVLWDSHFDEVLAVTYVAQLRQAGIATKVVGLFGKHAYGQNGLLLTANYTLGEALPLAQQAVCVVVPCHSPALGHVDTDPRVRIFLERAAENGARFVAGRVDGRDLEIFPVAGHLVEIAATESTLTTKAGQLGNLLMMSE